jgi:hypothetical protein
MVCTATKSSFQKARSPSIFPGDGSGTKGDLWLIGTRTVQRGLNELVWNQATESIKQNNYAFGDEKASEICPFAG